MAKPTNDLKEKTAIRFVEVVSLMLSLLEGDPEEFLNITEVMLEASGGDDDDAQDDSEEIMEVLAEMDTQDLRNLAVTVKALSPKKAAKSKKKELLSLLGDADGFDLETAVLKHLEDLSSGENGSGADGDDDWKEE